MNTVAEQPTNLAPEVADFCRRAVEALRAKLPVREVWLFGSHAERKANEHSDVDLLVVLANDHGLTHHTRSCFSIVADLDDRPPVDVLALSESRWSEEKLRRWGLYGEIIEKGVRLS